MHTHLRIRLAAIAVSLVALSSTKAETVCMAFLCGHGTGLWPAVAKFLAGH